MKVIKERPGYSENNKNTNLFGVLLQGVVSKLRLKLDREKDELPRSRKGIPTKENRSGKDSGTGKCLLYLRNTKKSSLAGSQENGMR